MSNFPQAIIMAFREGLEAFLIVVLLLKYLEKSNNINFKKYVWYGVIAGIIVSINLGVILMYISSYTGGLKTTAKLWESFGGFIAILFVTTFIIWMIKHGSNFSSQIIKGASQNLTIKGILLLTMFMVTREGAEIAIFSFAGKYQIIPVLIGLGLAVIFTLLINYSLVKVNIKTIFTITLAYLIIQAGYLLGYSIHEGISAAKSLGWLHESSPIFTKLFNLSNTIFNHKQGIIGLPLNVALGWYSKPEWVQFISQYGFTFMIFVYWYKRENKEAHS